MLQKYDRLYDEYYSCDSEQILEYAERISAMGCDILDGYKGELSLNSKERKEEIVVSLTSIPKRLGDVVYPIKCMFLQTVKPDRITLWLDKDRLSDELLPDELLELRENGLEIYYVEDIGPHTKYHYAMKKYSDSIIITIDDDVFYKRTLIEGLLRTYENNPGCVCAYWVWEMKCTRTGLPFPYREFKLKVDENDIEPKHSFKALGVGGVLYPPQLLDEKVFDIDVMKKLALKNDDVWLKAIEVISDVKVARVQGKFLKNPYVKNSQDVALKYENHAGRNDAIIRNVFLYFNLMQYFQNEPNIKYTPFKVLKRWLLLMQKGIRIEAFLEKQNIKTVAIYGMGEIGSLLMQELMDSKVTLCYGIDQNAEQIVAPISVVKPDEIIQPVDAVIVAANVDYKALQKRILSCIETNVLLLDDIFMEMEWELYD